MSRIHVAHAAAAVPAFLAAKPIRHTLRAEPALVAGEQLSPFLVMYVGLPSMILFLVVTAFFFGLLT